MDGIKVIIELLIYNCTVPSVVLPNLILGLVTAGTSAYLLKRGSLVGESFYQFTNGYRFVISACVGVVLSSPLPFWGRGSLLKLLSIIVLLIVLFVVSYMDEKTTYFIVGYMIVGILIQIVLLFIVFCMGFEGMSPFSIKMLVLMAVFTYFLALIRAYSYGDMGLMYMVLLSFLVMKQGDFFYSMMVAYAVSFVSLLVRDTVRLPKRIRNKEELKFAHSLNIVIGVLAAFFFNC